MLPGKKPRRTTDSRHGHFRYPNLTLGLVPRHPNHVWYADITYIWIESDVLYLHLITDGYSHAVIGWCLSETLEAEHTAAALDMAIGRAGGGNLCGTVHHSDRGVQYACRMYVGRLMEHHIRISMTESYKPTDNAVAERMNGILKDEWILPYAHAGRQGTGKEGNRKDDRLLQRHEAAHEHREQETHGCVCGRNAGTKHVEKERKGWH